MTLLLFGYGYSAAACVERMGHRFAHVSGTTQSAAKAAALTSDRIDMRVFGSDGTDPTIRDIIGQARAILVSIPPRMDGSDPVLDAYFSALSAAPDLAWIGYLSTVGVYGDHGGGWVDEKTPCRPVSPRSVARLAAENAWRALGHASGKTVAILRLSGIYGPGRSALDAIARGEARRVIKPGQVFNRIHVADIAGATDRLERGAIGGVFNVTDDEPAPPQDVVMYAHALAGVTPPPEQDFETANLSPMARSFYNENKRVSNAKLKSIAGYEFAYPSYREGLRALAATGN